MMAGLKKVGGRPHSGGRNEVAEKFSDMAYYAMFQEL
jgi:hypothetical protein